MANKGVILSSEERNRLAELVSSLSDDEIVERIGLNAQTVCRSAAGRGVNRATAAVIRRAIGSKK